MIKKLTLFVGFGAGYVLGAKAGTERYEQIQKMVDNVMGKSKVQTATETLRHTPTNLADKIRGRAVDDLTDEG